MAELKTKRNDGSVTAFLNDIADEQRRRDAVAVMALMQQVTKAKPVMWGTSIVGFGEYHYKYASGREGDWFLAGFSPRKQNLTLYIMAGFAEYGDLLRKLGKHSTGGSCLYLKNLDDVHMPTLKKLVSGSVKHTKQTAKANAARGR